MKRIILSLFLLGLICPLYGQAPKATLPKEEVVEYNLGSCGGDVFTVEHALVSDHQILFTSYLSDPQTVEKSEYIFDILKEDPKDGVVKFSGKLRPYDEESKKLKLEVNGFIKSNRLIMTLTVDGDLGHAFYGEKGSVDDMVKVAGDHYDFCKYLHTQEIKDIPDALIKWLNHAKDSQ